MKVEINDWDLDSLTQQSRAWYDVVDVLTKLKPGFMLGEGTGSECAVRAIRELAAQDICFYCGYPNNDEKMHNIPGNNQELCSHVTGR